MKWKNYIPFYKRNLKVAIPIMLTQLGGGIVQLADTIMVGHLGTEELAAAAFANSIFVIGMVFTMGATMGITPLIGAAFVRKQNGAVTRLLHNGTAFTLLLGLVITAILTALIPFLDNMGQVPRVASLARPYYITLVVSLLPFLLFCVCKQFLEGLGNTKIAMVITIIANLLNILMNYIFIFGKWGCPQFGVFGAGLATLISRLLMPVMFWFVLKRNVSWWNFIRAFRWKLLSWSRVLRVAKIGLPIGGHMLLETTAFALSAIMVGWLGAVPLAAHQIAQNISHIAFMMITGVSSATTIRISHQLGMKDFYALRMAGNASVHLCLLVNAIMATLMITLRHQIPWIFTTEAATAAAAAPLLVLAGFFQISDGLQAVGAGILRGLTDVKKPMFYAFIAYICINLPLGYVLAFPVGMGASGVWTAFVVGLSIAAVLFHIRCRKQIDKLEKEYEQRKQVVGASLSL